MKQLALSFALLSVYLPISTTYILAQDAAPTSEVKAQAAKKRVGPKLSWAPPTLTDPITVELTEAKPSLKLDQTKDYIVRMPGKPLKTGARIWGGRNVVLIGGEIQIPSKEEAPDFKGETRALYLNSQTGNIHIEGLLIGGKGLTEGFNLDQRHNATVQLQNIRIETTHGTRAGHHADLLQTWAGPSVLRIDRMTGSTGYQGFFLLPNQHFKTVKQDGVEIPAPQPTLFDFRHININGNDRSAYLLWRPNPPSFPMQLKEVWLAPNPAKGTDRDSFLWPKPSTGDTAWADAKVGTPPEGDFVTTEMCGLHYISPGYLEASLEPGAQTPKAN